MLLVHLLQALRAPEHLGITGTFDLVSITPPDEEVVYADLINDVMNSPVSTCFNPYIPAY